MSVLPTPVKDAAVQNNQRIFNTYEASLSDTTHYIEFAGKFALWLDSDRAFYAQGKPSIVSILMTAYRTVHRTICPQQNINDVTLLNMDPYKNHTLVLAYRHLIEVLSKYVKHFLDDAVLRTQVQFLLHTVGMHLNADARPHISAQPQSPIVQRPPAPVRTEQEPPRASTSRAGSSQSPAPLSLPKKKKRNFDLLIKQDLDWYTAQNSSAPKTQGVPANEPSSSKSPLTTDTETKLVPTSAPVGTAPVRPSEPTSTSGLAVTPQDNAFQTIIQAETKPVPQNDSFTASGIVAEVESKPNVLGEWTVFRDAIPPELKPLSENGEIADDGMEGVSEADETDQLEDDVPMASPQGMDIDDGSNEREEVAKLLDTSTTSITVNTDQGQIGSIPHEAEDSEMEGGVHAGERSEAVLHIRGDIQEPSGTPHGRNENAYLSRHSTPADARNSLSTDAASHAGVPVEPANLRNVDEIQPQNVAVASPPPPDPIVPPVKEDLVLPSHDGFNNNMIKIWLTQGKDSPCEHKFNVDVTESAFVQFVNWNQRNKNAREVETSKCVSLCCYKTTDVATLMKRGARGLELMNSLCISWPQAGGLKLLVTIDGQQKMVPLSPPTVVTAGLLDLTLFLQVGSNDFVVVQERSMTEYVFMVFAHDPTRAQLEPVVERRKKEEDWKTVLNHLSRPLELLPGPWD